MTDCKFYDDELDCCKLFSDWTEPMPVIQHCVEGACSEFMERKDGANNDR